MAAVAQMTRRDFVKASSAALAGLPVAACISRPLPVRLPSASAIPAIETGSMVNDIHSQLNATRVAGIAKPGDVEALRAIISRARADGMAVSIAGGRHAMGGQQF